MGYREVRELEKANIDNVVTGVRARATQEETWRQEARISDANELYRNALIAGASPEDAKARALANLKPGEEKLVNF